MADADLTAKRLRALLNYDEDSGVFTWRVQTGGRGKVGQIAGHVNADGYRRIRIDGKNYRAPRLAWLYVNGEWPVGVVDHIDRDRTNDRIANLRDTTHAENSRNVTGLSPYGRYITKRGQKYRVLLRVGSFDTLQEAIAARNRAIRLIA